jgi:hypothetical protein
LKKNTYKFNILKFDKIAQKKLAFYQINFEGCDSKAPLSPILGENKTNLLDFAPNPGGFGSNAPQVASITLH